MLEGAEKAAALIVLSGQVLDAAIEVHRVLGGPGLLERHLFSLSASALKNFRRTQ